jgi:hypothetical protein
LGFLTKTIRNRIVKANKSYTAWILNESTYENNYGAHTQSNKVATTYHHILALIGKGITIGRIYPLRLPGVTAFGKARQVAGSGGVNWS